jgi:alkanesulfonate monooxygenase SsuD/methylene tetrahydromethanopterin reductase-like flavin-dependent oxidoreductase (luciferase family)
MKTDPFTTGECVDVDCLADQLWFVGSPDPVAEQILQLHQETGGFGHLVIVSYDGIDEREPWTRSVQLLVEEVLPRCQASGRLDGARFGGQP